MFSLHGGYSANARVNAAYFKNIVFRTSSVRKYRIMKGEEWDTEEEREG